ncbi:MAG: amidohydrolase [Saprospiraceae bacterium]|nr:amidohydrolase [Saprospiraceae bacterium]
MHRIAFILILVSFLISLMSCDLNQKADTLIYNANVYTLDPKLPLAEAIAIKNGEILAVGSNKSLLKYSDERTEKIDAQGNFVMPGFIEGHGHFSGLGYSLINLNFLTSRSWESIVQAVEDRVLEVQPGEWIIGRGWHQEKWDSIPLQNIHNYPFHYSLSDVSPDNPVVLFHASGHSLYANEKAMQVAGVSRETPNPMGGEIVRDKDGNAIGVFEERAMGIIREKYSEYIHNLDQKKTDSTWYKAISLAQEECLKKGVTSFQDAGSGFDELDKYERLAKEGKLDVRLWAMLRHPAEVLEGKVKKYKKTDVGNRFYTCNAIKSEVDGALGAFGAWLIDAYADKPDFKGQNTTDIFDVKKIAEMAIDADMQFCVHAIGDRANRVVLDIYEGVMKAHPKKKDLRWRIEHAQHLDTTDIPRFSQYGIIASMQGIHCTSDAPFVVKRLGTERAKYGAYPWRSLLDNGVIIANGTDAPVEDVDPIKSFYASVTRKREDSGLVFFPEQRMTRAEAIYSYTLGNAYAAFQEKYKGSIKKGKVADLVILSQDLLNCSDDDILKTKILYTIVDGKVKYKME